MHHADRIIERVVVDHEPRMTGAGKHHDEFADGDVLLHGDDIGARYHDALDPAFAQTENILEHRRLYRWRETRFGLLGREDEFKVGARRRGLPTKQDAHDPREPSLTQLAGLRQDHGKTAMLDLVLFAARRA
jgi:hypothetical protein